MKRAGSLASLLIVYICTSCSGGGGSRADTLTGVWESEFNNIKYLLNDNRSKVSFKVCNSDEPITLTKSGSYLKAGDEKIFKINSKQEIEFLLGGLKGNKLHRENSNNRFNSGSFSIESSNIENLAATTDVCAYRESDGRYNIVSAPYVNSYIQLTIDVSSRSVGNFIYPGDDISITLESDELPGQSLDSFTASLEVIEYTETRFSANYEFTAQDGNAYSGSVSVDL